MKNVLGGILLMSNFLLAVLIASGAINVYRYSMDDKVRSFLTSQYNFTEKECVDGDLIVFGTIEDPISRWDDVPFNISFRDTNLTFRQVVEMFNESKKQVRCSLYCRNLTVAQQCATGEQVQKARELIE